MPIGFTKKLQLQIAELTTQNESLQNTQDSLVSQVSQQTNEISTLRGECATLRNTNHNLQIFKDTYKDTLQTSQDDHKKAQDTIQELRDQIIVLKAEKEVVEDATAATNAKLQSTEEQLEMSRQLASDLTDEIRQGKEQRQQILHQNDKMINRNIELEAKIQKMEKEKMREHFLERSSNVKEHSVISKNQELYNLLCTSPARGSLLYSDNAVQVEYLEDIHSSISTGCMAKYCFHKKQNITKNQHVQ